MADMNIPATGKVKVVFPYGQGEEGKQPIDASLNGRAIQIPRNVEVILDVAYLHGVFNNAQAEEYRRGEDGRGISKARLVPRYPYSIIEVIKDVSAEEKAASKTAATAKV